MDNNYGAVTILVFPGSTRYVNFSMEEPVFFLKIDFSHELNIASASDFVTNNYCYGESWDSFHKKS